MDTVTKAATQEVFLSPAALLEHWQGHRRLTRRTTEAFPEDQLFSFAADSMRSFGAMGIEIAIMMKPTLQYLLRENNQKDWQEVFKEARQQIATKSKLLELWDESSSYLTEAWPRIPQERFYAVESAFGLPPDPTAITSSMR